MTLTLRPYQRAAIDALYAYMENSGGNPLVVLPTGTGKSCVIAQFCMEALEFEGTRILIVTHQKELILQNFLELKNLWPEAPAGIYSAGLNRRDLSSRIIFCGIQSIHRHAFTLQKIDLVLVDECFPAGTMIDTPNGPVAIEKILPGDQVSNASGFGTVQAVSRRLTNHLMEIRTNDGRIIRCTENHPIFTAQGFIEAGKLEVGRRLFRKQDLLALWRRFSSVDQAGGQWADRQRDEAEPMGEAALLLNILLEECGERDAAAGGEGEDGRDATVYRTPADQQVRKRHRHDGAAGSLVEGAGRGMGCGMVGPDKEAAHQWISHLLQAGFGEPKCDDRDRGGWDIASRETTAAGHEERYLAGGVWVESVSRVECESAEPVFNLQVSGHPSYFADGVLVHNCHLIPRSSSTLYNRFLSDLKKINPYVKVIGFTATPYRMDSGMMHKGEGRIFHDIAYEYPILEAINDGYLTRPVSKSATQQIDTTGVKTAGGEFVQNQLEAAAIHPEVVQAVVKEIVAAGREQGRSGWIVFGCGVHHCELLAAELVRQGVNAAVITGETPAGQRDSLIRQFKARQVECLVSMNVLTTGFNAKHVDLVAIVRPTKSVGLYIQIVGRGTRTLDMSPFDAETKEGRLAAIAASSKPDFLCLDFGGNIDRHGPIDKPKVKGEKKKGAPREGEPVKHCMNCEAPNKLSASRCIDCGADFPPVVQQVAMAAATTSLLSVDQAIAPPLTLEVSDVTYRKHIKVGSKPSLRVDYLCGLIVHSEWVALEHPAMRKAKALLWWRRRAPAGADLPETVDEVLEVADSLKQPVKIIVRKEGQYTRVIGEQF